MMLSQHAMHQLIASLGSSAIQACNAVKIPYRRACRSSEQQGERDRVETSGFLAYSYQQTIEHLSLGQLETSLIP